MSHHAQAHDQTHDHGHSQPHTHDDPRGLAQLLDLDGEVLHEYLAEVVQWLGQLPPTPPGRILDLGAGTGAGTIALATHFDSAEIVAVDQSDAMLAAVRSKADARGLSDRISTVRTDLSAGWPAGASADLIWAAASLHEVPDPAFVLASAYRGLAAGGLIAVSEMDAAPRFLPENIGIGVPGFESRLHAALDAAQIAWSPHPDWTPYLEAAGFAQVEKRAFTIDLPAPQPDAVGRYAHAYFSRINRHVAPQLSAEDRETLEMLISADGPAALLNRDDLSVRAGRTLWVGRRAHSG